METNGCSYLFPATLLKKEARKQSTRRLTHFIIRVCLCWNITQSHHSPEDQHLGEVSQPRIAWGAEGGIDKFYLFKKKYGSLSSPEDSNPESVHVEVSSSDSYFNKPVSLGKRLPRSSKLIGGDNVSVGVYWNRNIKHKNLCIHVPWASPFCLPLIHPFFN